MLVAHTSVEIEAGGCTLPARRWSPPGAVSAVVIDLQPSELERLLSRDRSLLEVLGHRGFEVLAVGLLTADEASSEELSTARRFDVDVLSWRVTKIVDWLREQGITAPIGLAAGGTASAAALAAATRRRVNAIVSIAGRPDLAAPFLPRVESPTLLVVGAEDVPSLHYSQLGADRLHCTSELQVVPEGGSPDLADAKTAAEFIAPWFERHLVRRSSPPEAIVPLQSAPSTPSAAPGGELEPGNFFASRKGVCVYVQVAMRTFRVQFTSPNLAATVEGGLEIEGAEEARRIAGLALERHARALAPLFEKVESAARSDDGARREA